ncbi:amidohydrolase 2 [Calocera viscosa TUFC12733]|uniref:Amidohydrolase 2 n=1 Tax=Calocera viscosa (strain TUFC12733) TaxID=1330018 RepID=A0A167M2V0_CALVF|nr:amidohydrolase 2 [Calocera viscosa TUFC12733]
MSRKLLVDIHTHLYLPRYAQLLRARSQIPRITTLNGEERLVILAGEASTGRPVGPSYWDRNEKLRFMDTHGIDVSIVSPANPWLDFLPPAPAAQACEELNSDLEEYCATSPQLEGTRFKRLYGMAYLPVVPGAEVDAVCRSVESLGKLPHIKGVILGTQGLGQGLDDPVLLPMWETLARAGLVVFLHPHYGMPPSVWGAQENGHVLPLALGFPFETTTAVARLILTGLLDKLPTLKLLLAHSGGALPVLSSRLASCIAHDPVASSRPQHDARYYLGRMWYDAVAYGPEELAFVASTVGRAGRYAGNGKEPETRGTERLLWGTDHPFFPPLKGEAMWMSVTENLDAVKNAPGWSEVEKEGVRGGNAVDLFGL